MDESVAPFISVIVPAFNDASSLHVLLRALEEQDYPHQRFECLVVDNASTEPLQIAGNYAFSVRVLEERRKGSYAARNHGVRHSRGQVLAFTDADCIPRRDWLSLGVRRLAAAEGPAMLAGRIEVSCPDATTGSVFQWHSVANDLNQHRFLSRFHFAATANMITTRDVFERIGDFNPALYSGGDVDWGLRAWSSGIQQIYADDVVVCHPARASWGSLVAKTRRIAGGHYALNRRTVRPLTATAAMTLSIAAASWRRSWSDPRLASGGRRLRVIGVDVALRLIQFFEVVRLHLGGRPLNG